VLYRRQSIPMEQWKIRHFATLYPFNRLLPNVVRVIKSGTPTHMLSFVKFRWVKYNRSATFLFSYYRLAAKLADGSKRQWLKTSGICKGCAFGGLGQKYVTPFPIPQILTILHNGSCFSLWTRINIAASTAKFRSRIRNRPWKFHIFS